MTQTSVSVLTDCIFTMKGVLLVCGPRAIAMMRLVES